VVVEEQVELGKLRQVLQVVTAALVHLLIQPGVLQLELAKM
jgi:hypothetical protein